MNLIKLLNLQQNQRIFGQDISNNHIHINNNKSILSRINKLPNASARAKPIKKCKLYPKQTLLLQAIDITNEIEVEDIVILQNKPQAIDEYEEQIFDYMLQEEKDVRISDYFLYQQQISQQNRRQLLNWIVEVHKQFKLSTQTLFFTVDIIDQYLEKQQISKNEIQLLGISALLVATKFQETYNMPGVSNMQYICAGLYKKQQIIWMECKILQTLQFNLMNINSFMILQGLKKYIFFNEKDYFLARYLIEIALIDFKMRKYKASQITAASIFFIKKIRKREVCWGKQLQNKTGYSEDDLKQCARQLCKLLQNIQGQDHFKNLRNKFSDSSYKQVGKLKIGDKKL